MIYAVFLCDKQWKITNIRQCDYDLQFKEGDYLTDLITDEKSLNALIEKQYLMELNFLDCKESISAVIDSYKEGNLVILVNINNNQEFVEFISCYQEYQEWAKDHLLGLFHNEYYLIQQMNNQLVDAQRKLMRSNRNLEQALKENKEINQKLDEARKLAEHANHSKTSFLANMSHDIRTPLNAIVGLAELMQHNLDKPMLLENYIAKLRSSSQYLLDLINDILDLSKIENGSMELKNEPMDVGTQIEQIITIIRPQINKKKLDLTIESGDAKFGYLFGDPVRFRQILMNVFSNAIKYTPQGGNIYFGIHETISEEQKIYHFVIEDSGIGMSPEFMGHIFEPFARAETYSNEIQGTGLGMAITKSIVDALGGNIQVFSKLGEGSRFEIVLPFEICQDTSVAEKEDIQTNDDNTGGCSLSGMHFLCAEDNELNAEILACMMEMQGAKCDIYENGKLLAEAFEHTELGQYDAILMDIQMPVMDGYDATRQIRHSKNPLGKKIPIIAMTANAFSEDIKKCIDAGMDAHIAKPVDFDKLKETINNLDIIDKVISDK